MAASTSSGSETVDLNFEQALKRLNALVEKLESGQLPLEESVAAFEEGVKLTRHCEALLDSAEQRLQVLDKNEPIAKL
ncbi:MAG: exodeoxyribonuclease VII small subunit [Mariprofundaceae bacterium]|nr:exodeoxyribonuclease VII small subunit [Mariprofundaceae bacterium]